MNCLHNGYSKSLRSINWCKVKDCAFLVVSLRSVKMKSTFLICLFLGLAAFTFASPIEELDSMFDANNEVEDPDWVPPEIDDSDETWGLDEDDFKSVELEDDEDDEDERGLFTNSKGKHRCSCASGNSCGCCASPRIPLIGKVPACLNVTVQPEEKTMEISVEAKDKVLIKKKFSTEKADRVCDRLPGALDSIKICLYTDTTELADKAGIQSCAKIDILKGDKTVGKIQFACAQFKDGQLSLNDAGAVSAKDFIKIKTGDPIKGIMNWLGLREPSKKD